MFASGLANFGEDRRWLQLADTDEKSQGDNADEKSRGTILKGRNANGYEPHGDTEPRHKGNRKKRKSKGYEPQAMPNLSGKARKRWFRKWGKKFRVVSRQKIFALRCLCRR